MTTSPAPPARILVVCTANICRSPMAAALLQAFLGRTGAGAGVEVTSAGTHARPGQPVADGMLEVAERWGLDLHAHRARAVEPDLLRAQDLVVTMEGRHRDRVAGLAPGVARRVFLATEVAALATRLAPATPEDSATMDGLPGLVARLQQARARQVVDAPDVPDPYGGPAAAYRDTACQLASWTESVGPLLGSVVTAA